MDSLPREILQQISSFLDVKSCKSMRLASTQWFNIININFNGHISSPTKLKDLSDRLLSTYKNRDISLTIKLNPSISNAIAIEHISILTNLTSLSLSYSDYSSLQIDPEISIKLTALTRLRDILLMSNCHIELFYSLSQLTKLHLDKEGLKCSDVAKILSNNSNVQSLVIQSRPEHDADIFDAISNPSRLTSFKISVAQYVQEHEFSISKLTNLKSLDYYDFGNQPNVYFPIQMLSSLEFLSINSNNIDRFDQNTNLTGLAIGKSIESTIENIKYLTRLTKIKYLRMFSSIKNSEYKFLTALTALSNFIFSPHSEEPQVNEVFEYMTGTNLTELNMDISSNLKNVDSIQRLTSLQSLRIRNLADPEIDYNPIGQLTNLTKLFLRIPLQHTPENLTQLTNLKYLEIESVFRQGEHRGINFGALTNLETLNVYKMDGDTFNSLVSLTNLTHLRIKLPAETNRYNYSILTRLPLQGFWINGTKESDELWRALGELTSLESLHIPMPKNSDKLSYVTHLTRLTKLVPRYY